MAPKKRATDVAKSIPNSGDQLMLVIGHQFEPRAAFTTERPDGSTSSWKDRVEASLRVWDGDHRVYQVKVDFQAYGINETMDPPKEAREQMAAKLYKAFPLWSKVLVRASDRGNGPQFNFRLVQPKNKPAATTE